MMTVWARSIICFCLCFSYVVPVKFVFSPDERDWHPHKRIFTQNRFGESDKSLEAEKTTSFWRSNAQKTLKNKLNHPAYNLGVAKNVILFLGDGMSIPTITAARIYGGQLSNQGGENNQLAFDKFPYVGLSKTYCVDSQVADSACTSTAYLGGVKANLGTIGVTAAVPLGDCTASMNKSTHVDSIVRWSQLKNKRTGIVTTARVTHASPTGAYGSIADRNWECDADVAREGQGDVSVLDCPDIAQQLVDGETGRNLNVILGGGRGKMLPKEKIDEEGKPGERLDGKDLIDAWKKQKKAANAKYVWNRSQLQSVPANTDYLLGLFESSHMKYHLEANPQKEPTLAEMVEAAIKVLSRGDDGFFLFVEGAQIDIAHHETLAKKALDETVEFSKAVQKASDLTSPLDTLIVVTSDHAHTMSLAGYPARGNDILGNADQALDRLPYSTLSYANGPGYLPEVDGQRNDLNQEDKTKIDYKFPAMVPLNAETHGGDDVAIFAHGPWAHLFTGVNEQNMIPHIMAFASCVGNGATVCNKNQQNQKNQGGDTDNIHFHSIS